MFCQNTETRVKTPNHTSNRRPRRATCPRTNQQCHQGAAMVPNQGKTPRHRPMTSHTKSRPMTTTSPCPLKGRPIKYRAIAPIQVDPPNPSGSHPKVHKMKAEVPPHPNPSGSHPKVHKMKAEVPPQGIHTMSPNRFQQE